jgi:putative ABC transport system ATP-binding protein
MTPAPDRTIQLSDLHKRYREGDQLHTVLDGASASIAGGERVAILGPSGSGKSTLLNLISGIDLPDAGTVRIGGRDLTALSERERTLFRREHVGFVFQFFNLLPTLTVMENLLLPLELAGSTEPQDEARARTLLERVGLADRAETFPDRLSGGEQQRVAIARALLFEPRVLFADEPTGNLDSTTSKRIWTMLGNLATEHQMTILMVTHEPAAAAHCHRVFILGDGRVTDDIEVGEHDSAWLASRYQQSAGV